MANGQLNLGKQSGGVLSISFPDGATNTEVVLPESGNIVSIDGSVTDNAVARYDGVTGKLQDSGVIIDDDNTVKMQGSIGNVELGKLGAGNNITFSRNGQNYITANGGTNSSLYFGTGHSGQYYENTKMLLDPSGNLLLTSGTGALGYGAGGTVTQLTSKSTAVTLNKPTGRITMNNAALAAGASAYFTVNNSLVGEYDTIIVFADSAVSIYIVDIFYITSGAFGVRLYNTMGTSLSEYVNINFSIIKGAVS